MGITVAVLDDGSVAIRGAVDVLRESERHAFLGAFEGVGRPAGPCVLLADPFTGTGPGLAELAGLPGVPMLVMSASVRPAPVRLALRAGARGYIGKDADVATLLAAIDAVAVGGLYLGVAVDAVLINPPPAEDAEVPPRIAELTPRERDVLVMVAQGLTHKQIGSRLSLSKATVDTYVHRVRQKIGSVNKAGLTRVALELDLLGE